MFASLMAFRQSMLQTMVEYFDFFADGEGVLEIEINRLGIWIVPPSMVKNSSAKLDIPQKI